MSRNPNLVDLVGRQFGRLTVRAYAGSWKDEPGCDTRRHWDADCSCGGAVVASTADLTSGKRWHCDDCQPEQKGVDYRVDYREHMKTFTDDELRRLVAILRGRRSERDIAEAVDLVMRERSKTAA